DPHYTNKRLKRRSSDVDALLMQAMHLEQEIVAPPSSPSAFGGKMLHRPLGGKKKKYFVGGNQGHDSIAAAVEAIMRNQDKKEAAVGVFKKGRFTVVRELQ
ncbi:hypothetical protein HDU98_003501, partial [Podochytrium sp. JEL0797]